MVYFYHINNYLNWYQMWKFLSDSSVFCFTSLSASQFYTSVAFENEASIKSTSYLISIVVLVSVAGFEISGWLGLIVSSRELKSLTLLRL